MTEALLSLNDGRNGIISRRHLIQHTLVLCVAAAGKPFGRSCALHI